jgi:hypothetical protein
VLDVRRKYVAPTTLRDPLPSWRNSTLLVGEAAGAG